MRRRFPANLLVTACLLGFSASAQNASPPIQVARVGIALINNESRRMVSPKWEQEQLVRELKNLRTDRKSPVVIEPVTLENRRQKEALAEAAEKNCDYVAITTVVEPRRPGVISVGPSGVQSGPQIIGNVDPNERLAIRFTLLKPGSPRAVAEGFATAPNDDETSDSAAADHAVRSLARQIADELRKDEDRPPRID